MTRAHRRMPAAIAAALLALALPISMALPAEAAAPAAAPAAPSPTSTPTSGAKAASCPDYEYIGARGSGEDNNVPASTRYTAKNPTLGMGGPVSDVFKRVQATAAARDVTITPYAVPYPALGIDVISSDALVSGDLNVYLKSVELGAHAAAAELDRVSRACPHTGVIMAGYSQGAQAIVDAVLSATPGARRALVATVFFGNTYFASADSAEDYGSYAPGLDGYLARSVSGAENTSSGNPDWAAKFDGVPVFDYCHDGDPICGLVEERKVAGVTYPVLDFAHIVSSDAGDGGNPSILANHTTYQRGDTANAAQQLRVVLGLPLEDAPAPSAQITAPQTAEIGSPTRLNAGGSLSDPSDPIVSYRWTIDPATATARSVTTYSPLLSTQFFQVGAHTVSLLTTALSGAQATASVSITATAAPVAAPAAPSRISATPGDGAAALSWPAVKGAQFYAVTDANGKLLSAFTPLVADQQDVSWTDTGLSNGQARDYRVYAVNSMGRSTSSKTTTVTPKAAPQTPPAAALQLPLPATTLVDPELVWSLGLGLIVVVLGLALVRSGPVVEPGERRQRRERFRLRRAPGSARR